jgi:hypothetical protein
MSWREWAAAQYNHVLSIMKDTMDKTLFVYRHKEGVRKWL